MNTSSTFVILWHILLGVWSFLCNTVLAWCMQTSPPTEIEMKHLRSLCKELQMACVLSCYKLKQMSFGEKKGISIGTMAAWEEQRLYRLPVCRCFQLSEERRTLQRAQEVVGHWLAAETDWFSRVSTEILQSAHGLVSQGPQWESGSRKTHSVNMPGYLWGGFLASTLPLLPGNTRTTWISLLCLFLHTYSMLYILTPAPYKKTLPIRGLTHPTVLSITSVAFNRVQNLSLSKSVHYCPHFNISLSPPFWKCLCVLLFATGITPFAFCQDQTTLLYVQTTLIQAYMLAEDGWMDHCIVRKQISSRHGSNSQWHQGGALEFFEIPLFLLVLLCSEIFSCAICALWNISVATTANSVLSSKNLLIFFDFLFKDQTHAHCTECYTLYAKLLLCVSFNIIYGFDLKININTIGCTVV